MTDNFWATRPALKKTSNSQKPFVFVANPSRHPDPQTSGTSIHQVPFASKILFSIPYVCHNNKLKSTTQMRHQSRPVHQKDERIINNPSFQTEEEFDICPWPLCKGRLNDGEHREWIDRGMSSDGRLHDDKRTYSPFEGYGISWSMYAGFQSRSQRSFLHGVPNLGEQSKRSFAKAKAE